MQARSAGQLWEVHLRTSQQLRPECCLRFINTLISDILKRKQTEHYHQESFGVHALSLVLTHLSLSETLSWGPGWGCSAVARHSQVLEKDQATLQRGQSTERPHSGGESGSGVFGGTLKSMP